MFAVMKLQSFEVEPSPKNSFTLPIPIEIDSDKMVGFIPVYKTRRDALKDYPNAELVEIHEAE